MVSHQTGLNMLGRQKTLPNEDANQAKTNEVLDKG